MSSAPLEVTESNAPEGEKYRRLIVSPVHTILRSCLPVLVSQIAMPSVASMPPFGLRATDEPATKLFNLVWLGRSQRSTMLGVLPTANIEPSAENDRLSNWMDRLGSPYTAKLPVALPFLSSLK